MKLYNALMLLAAPLTVISCSSAGSNGHDPDAMAVSDVGGAAICPDASVPDRPSGACAGGVGCVFVLQNVCGPGVVAIAEGTPVYICDCVANNWQCTLQGGLGLGVILCDAGRD